jgi:hypothetical protein
MTESLILDNKENSTTATQNSYIKCVKIYFFERLQRYHCAVLIQCSLIPDTSFLNTMQIRFVFADLKLKNHLVNFLLSPNILPKP